MGIPDDIEFINDGSPEAISAGMPALNRNPIDFERPNVMKSDNNLYNDNGIKMWKIEDEVDISKAKKVSQADLEAGPYDSSWKTVGADNAMLHPKANPEVHPEKRAAFEAAKAIKKEDLTEGPQCPKCSRKVAYSHDSTKGTKQAHCPYCKHSFGSEIKKEVIADEAQSQHKIKNPPVKKLTDAKVGNPAMGLKKEMLSKAISDLTEIISNEINKAKYEGSSKTKSYQKKAKHAQEKYPETLRKEKIEKIAPLAAGLIGAGAGAVGASALHKQRGPGTPEFEAESKRRSGMTQSQKDLEDRKADSTWALQHPNTVTHALKKALAPCIDNITNIINSEISKANKLTHSMPDFSSTHGIDPTDPDFDKKVHEKSTKAIFPGYGTTNSKISKQSEQDAQSEFAPHGDYAEEHEKQKINPAKEKASIKIKKSITLNKMVLGQTQEVISDLELVKGFGSIAAIPEICKANPMTKEYFDYAITRTPLYSSEPFMEVCKIWYGNAELEKAMIKGDVCKTCQKSLDQCECKKIEKAVCSDIGDKKGPAALSPEKPKDFGGQSEVISGVNAKPGDLRDKVEDLKTPEMRQFGNNPLK